MLFRSVNLVKFRKNYFKLFTIIHIYIHPIVKYEEIKNKSTNEIADLLSTIINGGIK